MDPHKKVYVDEIRKVHKDLRRKYRKDQDFNKVWKNHCKDQESLDKYAKSMQDLATEIWDEDCDGTHRIKWCVATCMSYFYDGELEKLLKKDERRFKHFKKHPEDFHQGPNPVEVSHEDVSKSKECENTTKVRLLDVGSCYDPFRHYEEFETTAIDLKPATENVYECDFIDIEVTSEHLSTRIDSKQLHALPSSYFSIVVFSLLLTYIPCPKVRWDMCRKAYQVLKVDGLLLIITPDSSHQNKNAALMKTWKSSIEQIGFQRIKYEKDRHLHLMAFRKVASNFIWDKRKVIPNDQLCLNIPQDFQESSDSEDDEQRFTNEDDKDFAMNSLNELPLFDF